MRDLGLSTVILFFFSFHFFFSFKSSGFLWRRDERDLFPLRKRTCVFSLMNWGYEEGGEERRAAGGESML